MARVESEAGIIATLIHHPEFSYYSEQLLPNHFTNEENRYIYQAICSLARDGITTIDPYNICLLFCLFIYIIANSKIREPLNLEYLRRPISVPFLQSRFILQKKENLMWETVGLFMVANLH